VSNFDASSYTKLAWNRAAFCLVQ